MKEKIFHKLELINGAVGFMVILQLITIIILTIILMYK